MHTFVPCCLTVPGLESDDRTASSGDSLVHDGRPRQVCTWLVFWTVQTKYRRTFVSLLDDVADVVNTSADVNVAQTQNGETVVPMYNWTTFLGDHFRNVPQLKTFHHFTFSAQHPGVVLTKVYSDSAGTKFTMLHDVEWCPTPDRCGKFGGEGYNRRTCNNNWHYDLYVPVL